MSPRRRKRLDPGAFDLPVDALRAGRFSDLGGSIARELVREAPPVLLQVSADAAGSLSGIDEAIAVLKLAAESWSDLSVHALYEGDRIDAWDTVLTVEGPLAAFGHLQSALLGVLGRRTRVSTGARLAVDSARPKPVLYIGSREDPLSSQAGDGYAAHVAGIFAVTTPAQSALAGTRVVAVLPQDMIALNAGDTAAAARAFVAALDETSPDAPVVVPVDYNNDAVATSVAVARALEGRLWGVLVDTPPQMVDRSVLPRMGTFGPAGVSGPLLWSVREALDAEGLGDVRVVVGGGVDLAGIRALEEEKAPADAYAIGARVLAGITTGFFADVVTVGGEPQSRVGRELRANPKLERVK